MQPSHYCAPPTPPTATIITTTAAAVAARPLIQSSPVQSRRISCLLWSYHASAFPPLASSCSRLTTCTALAQHPVWVRGGVCACHPQSRAHARQHWEPMTDLLQVLPDFDTSPYTHLLPSLDKALVTSNDLLTLDAADVAKRAQLPASELRKLVHAVVRALHHQLGLGGEEVTGTGTTSLTALGNPAASPQSDRTCISTLDDHLDAALGGGIPPGYLVEITGERYGIPPPPNHHHHHRITPDYTMD